MRITEKEKEIIKRLAKDIFGAQTHVYLFGSRTSDWLKGGDIDLFITNENKQNLTLRSKLSFLSELKSIIGDQKIDVILDTESTKAKKNFYRSIQTQSLEL
ncbi:MAG: nucleotidyltransferase domain-containing protein [Bacteroidales bacterium]|nr:nucleotidyltransferase domain-containing protein [Candidatus Cloacimonadota bacterium]MBS3771940.1 nucleotidyltransferase domain-containing protein [Bacteroidales bacterium]